jgi:tetratricopeptide (TPR) repeat protein
MTAFTHPSAVYVGALMLGLVKDDDGGCESGSLRTLWRAALSNRGGKMLSLRPTRGPSTLRGVFAAFLMLLGASCGTKDAVLSGSQQRALLDEKWSEVAQFGGASTDQPVGVVLTALRGHALLALNRNDESLAAFVAISNEAALREWRGWADTFARVHPSSHVAQYLRGDGLARARQWDPAIAAYSKALKEKGDFSLALSGRGVAAFRRATRPEEILAALDDFEAAQKHGRPRIADAYANAGVAYLQMKVADKAAMMFDAALAVSRDFSLARMGRACASMATRETADRERALSELKALRAHRHLGQLADANLKEALGGDRGASADSAQGGPSAQPGTPINERRSLSDWYVVLETARGTAADVGTALTHSPNLQGAVGNLVLQTADRLNQSATRTLNKIGNPGGVEAKTGTTHFDLGLFPSTMCFGLLY